MTQVQDPKPPHDLAYGLTPTPLGALAVVITARGVCAVFLGDDEDEFKADFASRFGPNLRRDDAGLMPTLRAVVAVMMGRAEHGAVPRDVRATPFQREVWRTLQRIPRGETRSYQEVAVALGRPTSARAVARACASNPTAILVPCHRVVRQDGGLGGYRWKAARKARLLALERGEG